MKFSIQSASPFHSAKGTKNNQRTLLAIAYVAISFLLVFSTRATAQVYQVQPDGSLRYVPQLVNPYSQRPTLQQPIRSGQIINGQRVIGVSPSTTLRAPYDTPLDAPLVAPQSQPTTDDQSTPLLQTRQPSRPPATEPEQTKATNSQTIARPDKIPPTVFPIAQEPAPQTTIATDTIKTQPNPESSITKEDKMASADSSELLAPPLESAAIAVDEIDPEPNPINENASNNQTLDDAPPLAAAPASDPLPIDEDVMAEIKEIRQQLGSGISETLKGVAEMPKIGGIQMTPGDFSLDAATGGDASPEQLFSQQLRSVISDQQRGNLMASDQANASSEMDASKSVKNDESNTATSPTRVNELRACARELEELAGRLEAIDAYQAADNLRREASGLWTTARQR